jgi:hypothetical protein
MDELEGRRRTRELLEAILRRLDEGIEVNLIVTVVNESNPPVKMTLTPGQPKENT